MWEKREKYLESYIEWEWEGEGERERKRKRGRLERMRGEMGENERGDERER